MGQAVSFNYYDQPEDVAAAEGILRQAMDTMPDGLPPAEIEHRIERAMVDNGYEGVRVLVTPYGDEGVHVSMSRGDPIGPPTQRSEVHMTVGEFLAVAFAGLVFIGMATGLVALVWRLAS